MVLGDEHVQIALSHGVGHAAAHEPSLESLVRDPLETHGCPKKVRENCRHVVVGEVLRAQQGTAGDARPGFVEQQLGGGAGYVPGGDAGELAIAGDREREDAILPDGLRLSKQVVHEGRHGQGPVAHTAARDEIVHCERSGDEARP